MSEDRFSLSDRYGEVWAVRTEDPGVTLSVGDYFRSGNVWLTPEEAIRLGFHLAGMGANALREQR